MMREEITRHSACDLAALIADGDLSAREVVDAHVAAIESVNPRLNAVTARRYDAARIEAAAIDARRSRGEPLPALAGVPVTIKDALDLEGLPSTGGLPSRARHVAGRDAAPVARLRAAGAIALAKTNVAQGLIFVESDNPLFGRTSNPWNPARSSGGSSGGEGALVAAGASALGLGTDLGGSLRVPAAFCGIASLKPTAGRVPDPQRLSVPVGEEAIASQAGVLARRVADLAAGLAAIDPGERPLADWRQVEVRHLRVGVYEDDGLFMPAPAIRRAVREAAQALADAGALVVPWRIPRPQEAEALFFGALSADGMAGLRRLLRDDPRDIRVAQLLFVAARSPRARGALAWLARSLGQRHLERLLRGAGLRDVDAYWRLCEARVDYTHAFLDDMHDDGGRPLDLLLGPATALPAFTHGASKDLGLPGIYTSIFNVTGLPAGVVPVTRVRAAEESERQPGRDLGERAAQRVEAGSAGLPVAVQVAARPWCEHAVLAAMGIIEGAAARDPDYPATPHLPPAA